MKTDNQKTVKTIGLLPPWLRNGFTNLLNPLVSIFIKMKISPNAFTVCGLLITTFATVLIALDKSYIHWAGFLILMGGICDILDGKIARRAGLETRFGALFDSVIDRYSEVVMFFGIALFYVRDDNYLLSIVVFVALGGSTMVSYIRARAENLQYNVKVGLMQRPERIVFIGAGALFYYPLFNITIFHVENFTVTLLEISVWIVAVLSNTTAIQRLIFAYKQDR